MRSLTLRSVDVVKICLFIDFWPKRGFRFGRNWEFGLIVGLKWKLALLQENVWPQDHLSHRSSTNSISNPFCQRLFTFFSVVCALPSKRTRNELIWILSMMTDRTDEASSRNRSRFSYFAQLRFTSILFLSQLLNQTEHLRTIDLQLFVSLANGQKTITIKSKNN